MGQPYLDQQNFRVGNDDGSESGHGWLGTLGQDLSIGPGQTIQDGEQFFLRFTIANTGAKVSSGLTPTIEISYNGGGYATIGSTGAIKYATNATYLTDGENTTDRLGGTGTFDTSNQGVIEGAATGANEELVNGFRYEVLIVLEVDQSQMVSNGDYYDIRVASMDNWTDVPRFTVANLPTSIINQTGFRFTSQDGTLSSPTWQAAANTNVTMQRGKTVQLWIEIEEAGGATLSDGYELTWQKNGTGGYTTLQGYPWISPTGSVPAVFGCESDFYANGDSITSNPINQSAKTFTNGHGVESTAESDVESNAVSLNNQCTVLCFTIRVPSLYGTTQNDANEKNAYYDFQVRRDDGTALDSTLTARYTLGDGNGHIGGCPAETQGKMGPWKDSNGNLYYVTERSEVDNHMCMMKSYDNGVNWAFADNEATLTDLESVDAVQVGDTIHIFYDGGGSIEYIPYYTSDHSTTPDSFGTPSTPVASKTENDQGCAVGYRSGTTDFVVFYRNGTTSEEIYYIIGTPGSWGSPLQLDSTNVNHIGVHVVKGADSDWLHIFYTTEETVPNTIRHRSMDPSDNSLSASEVVYSDAYDGGSGWQWAMTSAISWMSGSNDKVGIVVYDDSDNYPYFVAITDDGSPGTPVQIDNVAIMNDPTWMTSRSPVGKLFADSNGNLQFIMADASTQDLWIYTSDDDGATWSDQTTPVKIQDAKTIEMVIGQALTLSGTEYDVYVYADRYGGFNDWVYFDTYTLTSDITINCGYGTATFTGQAATITPGEVTVTSSAAGSATFTGQLAVVSSVPPPVTVNCSYGTATFSGQTSTVQPGEVTVSCNYGSATFTGQLSTVVPGAVTVTAGATGSATFTGQTATVTSPAPQTINCNYGSATFTGQAITMLLGEVTVTSSSQATATFTGQHATVEPGEVTITSSAAGSATFTGQTATIANVVFVNCGYGSATFTGQQANVVPGPVTIDCNYGSITATGQQASILPGEVTVNCSYGTATFTGQSTTVTTSSQINCGYGTATFTGQQASIIPGAVTVSCSYGTATFSGQTANVTGITGVDCSYGSATFTGQTASVIPGEVIISCSYGLATFTGQTSTIDSQTTINCNYGLATFSGQSATVTPGPVTINCGYGSATLTGQSVIISSVSGVQIDCGYGSISATGQSTSIEPGAVSVGCNYGSASFTGQSSNIVPGETTISCGYGNVVIAGQSSNLLPGEISIGCSYGQIVITGETSSIIPVTTIPCSYGQIIITGQSATLLGDIVINTQVGSLLALGQYADIILDLMPTSITNSPGRVSTAESEDRVGVVTGNRITKVKV